MSGVVQQAIEARRASAVLAGLSAKRKNAVLERLAASLLERCAEVLEANGRDLKKGEAKGMSQALLDRLALNEKRVAEMAHGVRELIALADPIGQVIEEWDAASGLHIKKTRVPLGVAAIIYEARPNVTVDAAALCLKTGNAVVLRGSSSAQASNAALVSVIQEALAAEGLPRTAVQLIEDPRREVMDELLQLRRWIDVVIPRGGAGLIDFVVQKSRIPVLETGTGNCHVYVHADADPAMADAIVINAKVQRPSVCNAAETLLVHRDWAARHLRALVLHLQEKGVECRGCEEARALAPGMGAAQESDWETEFLDYIIAVKVVGSLDEAIAHVNRYGTKHSEAIVTKSEADAARFLNEVDAAAVYHNASTRFTDGFMFGFGAEIGISTQKLHARGPMGLPELTTYKYRVYGAGQVR